MGLAWLTFPAQGIRMLGKEGADMPILLDLFLTFAKIGLFTFGGGYAMLSVITDNCVEKRKWITNDDMMNITVIAETSPGPIAINCATFVGYRKAGVLGAIAATIGVIMPSFIIIYLISLFLDGFLEITVIANAFQGIKIGVGFLIVQAAAGMMKSLPKNGLSRFLLWGACAVMLLVNIFSWNFSSVALMAICATISFAVFMANKRKGGAEK